MVNNENNDIAHRLVCEYAHRDNMEPLMLAIATTLTAQQERVAATMRDACVATLRQIATDYDNVAQPNNGAAISKQAVLYAARQIESLTLNPASGDPL